MNETADTTSITVGSRIFFLKVGPLFQCMIFDEIGFKNRGI